MSARLYRKVAKEHEQSAKADANVITEELQDDDEEDTSDSLIAASVNLFELLNVIDNDHEIDQPNEGDGGSKETVTKKKLKKKKKKKNKEPSSSNHDGSSVSSKKSSILKVDSKFLNAENELRRIFGSEVVGKFENTNQTSHSKQGRSVKRGGYVHRERFLASPSEHWLRWDNSLFMERLEHKDKSQYFRYVRSSSCSQVQIEFESAKACHDLNGVASILLRHPYHVESLLTLADYFRYSGEYQLAADFIGKCLYALECAWHPAFDPLQGNCRLEYTYEINKPLFVALFNHMRNLDRRGCHRSALEVCKLLLSLDPTDPMGAMFCIDYFSLRAEEYTWLEKFAEEYQGNGSNSLWNFPNFAYSLPICRLYLERDNKQVGKETSDGLMKRALMLHPSVLTRLVEKVPLTDQAWTTIITNDIFDYEEIGIDSIDHLISIYIERSYILWRLPDVNKLLKNAALQVVETLKRDSSDVDAWDCVRDEAFPSDKNEYSHLLVSDFSDSVASLPADNLLHLLMYDPWIDEVEEIRNQPNQGVLGQYRAPRDLANRSSLAVLLESILPWVHSEIDVRNSHD